jgi:hypothetical protein
LDNTAVFQVGSFGPFAVPVQEMPARPTFPTPDDLVARLRYSDKPPLTALPDPIGAWIHTTNLGHYCLYFSVYSSLIPMQIVFHRAPNSSGDGGPWYSSLS